MVVVEGNQAEFGGIGRQRVAGQGERRLRSGGPVGARCGRRRDLPGQLQGGGGQLDLDVFAEAAGAERHQVVVEVVALGHDEPGRPALLAQALFELDGSGAARLVAIGGDQDAAERPGYGDGGHHR